MSDQLVYIPDSDDRPIRSGRRSVRNFLLGLPDDVDETIAELHLKQFGEVMRAHKRYLTK